MLYALIPLAGSILLHKLAMLLPIIPSGALMIKCVLACVAHHGDYGYDVVRSACVWIRRKLFGKDVCLGKFFSLNQGQRRVFP